MSDTLSKAQKNVKINNHLFFTEHKHPFLTAFVLIKCNIFNNFLFFLCSLQI